MAGGALSGDFGHFLHFFDPPILKSRKIDKKRVQNVSKIDVKKTCTFTMFLHFLQKVSKIDNFYKKIQNHAKKYFNTKFYFYKK